MNYEIEFCMQWNYKPDAVRVAAVIEEKTGESVVLIEGEGGIFDIRRNGNTIYSKQVGSAYPFPTDTEVERIL